MLPFPVMLADADFLERAGWSPPLPRSYRERLSERSRLLDTLASFDPGGRPPIRDRNVLRAMRVVPRHVFVPERFREVAYEDAPLPLGHGQTISQPYIVAFMTEALQVDPACRVLEIGTGSGYQAAVLGQLTPHVYTIESLEPLAREAERVLEEQGYDHVHCRCGDGNRGWPEEAPFDRILVTCSARDLPAGLWEQLRIGGRMVIPMGASPETQSLLALDKKRNGEGVARNLMRVRFVPFTGAGASNRPA